MKYSKLLAIIAGIIIIMSIGCSENNKKTDSITTTDTLAIEPTPAPTIITLPQLMLIARHQVSDFAKWKMHYDQHDSMRVANGLHNYVIGRSIEDSNMIIVVVKADDLAQAKAFVASPGLRNVMKKGGVVGNPQFTIANMVFQDTAILGNIPRALTSFTVKDWDAWKTNFELSNQERVDNGIALRTYGHEADDNHKVIIATALTDTAKARAYWTSDALKKRREAGGVTSTPDRFVFQIVNRY
jgi:hypothetical protein